MRILDDLRRDADRHEGAGWTVGIDAAVVRGSVTLYDKRDFVFRGTVDVASIKIWLRDPVP